MLQGSRVGMRKVGRLIERIDSKTFQSIEAAAAHHKRAHSAGLVRADHDKLQFPVFCKYAGTGLHPCELVHGAVSGIGEQAPSLCFILNRTEFMDNADRFSHPQD